MPQIAINWLLQRPTVSSVIIGARNETQLRQNLGAVGWDLDPEQMARLDAASTRTAPYPYFPYRRQEAFARLDPPMGAAAPAEPVRACSGDGSNPDGRCRVCAPR